MQKLDIGPYANDARLIAHDETNATWLVGHDCQLVQVRPIGSWFEVTGPNDRVISARTAPEGLAQILGAVVS
jgi:hypothetical protein